MAKRATIVIRNGDHRDGVIELRDAKNDRLLDSAPFLHPAEKTFAAGCIQAAAQLRGYTVVGREIRPVEDPLNREWVRA